MSAIREVVETATIPLNPSHVRRHHHRLRRSGKCKGGKGGFHDVPSFPFEIINNQKDKRHVEDIWTRHVCPTITKLCYARTSFFINKNIRKTAFHSSMSNICSEFNRKTLNVKVEFQITILSNSNSNNSNPSTNQQQTNKNNNKTNKTTYALKFSRLSDISDSILNNVGQYCTAEIPYRIPDPVMAELIGPQEEEETEEEAESRLVNNNSNNNEPNSHRSSSGRTTSSTSSSDAVGIVIDFVEEYSHQTTTRTTTRSMINNTINSSPHLPAVVINNSPDPSMENLPILSAVAVAVVILDDNDNDGNDNNEQACAIIRGEDEEIRMTMNNNGGAEPPSPIVTTAVAVYVETTIP